MRRRSGVGVDPAVKGRGRLFGAAGALVVVIGIVLTGIFWPGYKDLDAPSTAVSVWALNSKTSQYGRVNTDIAELESVASVFRPTDIVQDGNEAAVFADGNRKVAVIDPAFPADLGEATAPELQAIPSSIRSISEGGSHLLYMAADGALSTATIDDPSQATVITVQRSSEPGDDEQSDSGPARTPLRALAAAIGPDDQIVAVTASSSDFEVLRVDAGTGKILSRSQVAGELSSTAQITYVDSRWAVLDTGDEVLWVEGAPSPLSVPLDGQPWLAPPGSDALAVADSAGLYLIDPDATEQSRAVNAPAASQPAEPQLVDGHLTAAWLAQGERGGVVWDSVSGEQQLSYGGLELEGVPSPKILSNGARAVLNDTASGWVWLLPSAALVPSSQDWLADAQLEETTVDAEVQDVSEPKPPVAMPDHFGVRPGAQVELPVLLNDYDANGDVISIEPSSVTGLDPDFGTLDLVNGDQMLVVNVSPDAKGTASFTYQATDGTSQGGLLSQPAQVTLEVVPEDQDFPPFFAGVGVEDYLGQWPKPSVAPGGVATAQVLSNWIDPQGDALYLANATTTDPDAQVLSHPDGTVTLRHLDPSGDDLHPVAVTVTVASSTGASATKDLVFTVTPNPPVSFMPDVVAGVTNKQMQVDVEPLLSGGVGRLSIVEVAPQGDDSAVTVGFSGLTFTATATKPGSYPLLVTVEDRDGTSAQQTVRLVVTEPGEARISAAPSTVFIRAHEDTTVDLIPSIQNPAGEVLLVSDLQVEPEDGAELSVQIVGQQLVHASGRTGDDSPGRLGTATYKASDGSGSADAQATGTVTFILVETDSAPPIANDKWIRVVAGTQVDIPVLDWATAPVGAQLAIDQSEVVYKSDSRETGLAFATPRSLRYLAPTTPGEYSIGYTIFRLGDPQLTSTGNVNVVVLDADADDLSTPATLEGRVLAGSSVTIPLQLSAARMRGETFQLDSVVSQPGKGTAAVSPDGESLVYTANPGTSGQDSFKYQVRTESGRTATGVANVGILDAAQSPKPTLYSRYLQTAIGAGNKVSVFPLDNAHDPLGGALTLDEVWPNVPEKSPAFTEQQERLISVDKETGEVVIAADVAAGTTSFHYKAHNDRGDQATGLIVLKAVQNPTRDLPVVEDTRLDAESISQLPSGVNVLEDKVTWATGSPSNLSLELWGNDSGFRVSGSQISGTAPKESTIVPFRVRGRSFAGEEADSYGFLKIPATDDIPLTIRAGFPTPEVKEGESVTVDLASAIAGPADSTLVFDESQVAASGARANGRCTLSGTKLTYSAGDGAPWQDSCAIPVKTATQSDYTFLSLPIIVIAKDPEPLMVSASIEASPGKPAVTYDLGQMVNWQNGKPGDQVFQVSGNLSMFDWSFSGTQVTVTAKDTATPSRSESLSVALSNYPNVAPASLSVTVGPAAGESPKAGTASQACSSAGGTTSCVINVIGVPGQVNYLPGTPLKLVADSVVGPANCPGVTFKADSLSQVRATWSQNTPGRADCTGYFDVEDAQGRTSGATGRGTLLLDLSGLPARPDVNWTEATDSSLTFLLSSQGSSYPAVDAVTWKAGSSEGRCPATGACTVRIPAADLGVSKSIEFRATNAAGVSQPTTTTAWTYRPPSQPTIVKWEPNTDGNSVRVSATANASDASELLISGTGDSVRVRVAADGSANAPAVTFSPAGSSHQLRVEAIAKLTRPPETVAVPEAGSATATTNALAVGRPSVSLLTGRPVEGGTTILATASVTDWKGVGVAGTGTTRKQQLCVFVDDAPTAQECTDDSTLSYDGQYGEVVRFKFSAWGVGPLGNYLVGEATTDSSSLGVPDPEITVPYWFLAAGQPCAVEPGYESCLQWYETQPPVVMAAPRGVKSWYWVGSRDSWTGRYGSATAALNASQGNPAGDPLWVQNEADGAFSKIVEVPRIGGVVGKVQVRDMPKTCPPTHDGLLSLQPFDYEKSLMSSPVMVLGKGKVTWMLELPQGFTTPIGEHYVTWSCNQTP